MLSFNSRHLWSFYTVPVKPAGETKVKVRFTQTLTSSHCTLTQPLICNGFNIDIKHALKPRKNCKQIVHRQRTQTPLTARCHNQTHKCPLIISLPLKNTGAHFHTISTIIIISTVCGGRAVHHKWHWVMNINVLRCQKN